MTIEMKDERKRSDFFFDMEMLDLPMNHRRKISSILRIENSPMINRIFFRLIVRN